MHVVWELCSPSSSSSHLFFLPFLFPSLCRLPHFSAFQELKNAPSFFELEFKNPFASLSWQLFECLTHRLYILCSSSLKFLTTVTQVDRFPARFVHRRKLIPRCTIWSCFLFDSVECRDILSDLFLYLKIAWDLWISEREFFQIIDFLPELVIFVRI